MKIQDEELQSIYDEIAKLRERAAALRRKRKPTVVPDYVLTGTSGEKVKLSEMFGSKNELILIHNMGRSCRYCTLWADGLNGFTKHLESHAAFCVTTPDEPDIMRRFAMERGWTFKMYSTAGTTFKLDLGYADEKDNVMPGVSVFRKNADGSIEHVANDYFGPGDDYCSIWHFFDLLPSGSDDWEPQYHYITTTHKY